MIYKVDDIERVLVDHYHHDQHAVDQFILNEMNRIMERLRTDPDSVAPWAHDVLVLEEEFRRKPYDNGDTC